MFGDAYQRADNMLDRGQRHAFRWLWFFLPETSVAKDLRFQQVVASRFFSDAGQQAVAYGALIAVARSGGSALDLALIGMAGLLPPALLGLYGGAVADALPARVALAGIYNLQALFCFLVPFFAGTDLWAIFALILAVNILGQVSGPTESAVLPLVANEEQLASATSLVHLGSSAGTAFGTALLAPVLVRVFDEYGHALYQFVPYEGGFSGGVNVALGDVDGDGYPDVVTAPQSGRLPVRVFNRFGVKRSEFYPYPAPYRGGVNVALGDVTGDHVAEVATAPAVGGGPHVRVFTAAGKLLREFFAYAKTFRGGVELSVGDVDGDGASELVSVPGAGGGPHVRVFNSRGEVFSQFFVEPSSFRGGLTLGTIR